MPDFRPDSFLASGDVVGFNAQQPVADRITVVEAFAELAVPILADLPGASYDGLEFGYRNSNYNIASSYHLQGGAAVEPDRVREAARVLQPRDPRSEH